MEQNGVSDILYKYICSIGDGHFPSLSVRMASCRYWWGARKYGRWHWCRESRYVSLSVRMASCNDLCLGSMKVERKCGHWHRCRESRNVSLSLSLSLSVFSQTLTTVFYSVAFQPCRLSEVIQHHRFFFQGVMTPSLRFVGPDF